MSADVDTSEDNQEVPRTIVIVNTLTSRSMQIDLEKPSQVSICKIFAMAMQHVPSIDNRRMELAVSAPSCWNWWERSETVLCPGSFCEKNLDMSTAIRSHGLRYQLQESEPGSDPKCAICRASRMVPLAWRRVLNVSPIERKGKVRTFFVQKRGQPLAYKVEMGMKNTVQDFLDECKIRLDLTMTCDPYLVFRHEPYLKQETKMEVLWLRHSTEIFELSTAPVLVVTKRIRAEFRNDLGSVGSKTGAICLPQLPLEDTKGNQPQKCGKRVLDLLGAVPSEPQKRRRTACHGKKEEVQMSEDQRPK